MRAASWRAGGARGPASEANSSNRPLHWSRRWGRPAWEGHRVRMQHAMSQPLHTSVLFCPPDSEQLPGWQAVGPTDRFSMALSQLSKQLVLLVA